MPDHGGMPTGGHFRICFVCTGNICRSPMAEIVMRRLVEGAGPTDRVHVDSAGTGDWHTGERADRRALSVLASAGYDGLGHRARQFDPRWFGERDLVIALDRGHLRTLTSWAADDTQRRRIHLLRSFDPALGENPPELDVADPYYDGIPAFTAVLEQVEAACAGLLARVRAELDDRPVSTG
jgi:protein-tyrosine phosphatase